ERGVPVACRPSLPRRLHLLYQLGHLQVEVGRSLSLNNAGCKDWKGGVRFVGNRAQYAPKRGQVGRLESVWFRTQLGLLGGRAFGICRSAEAVSLHGVARAVPIGTVTQPTAGHTQHLCSKYLLAYAAVVEDDPKLERALCVPPNFLPQTRNV